MRDKLFLLEPDFEDGDGLRYYCPECAQIQGVLSFYPQLRNELEVEYVNFARPRKAIAELIGEANQGAPVLIVDDPSSLPVGVEYDEFEQRRFVSGAMPIGRYLAKRYGVAYPH
jgi:Protein of unknown function (DUF3088)